MTDSNQDPAAPFTATEETRAQLAPILKVLHDRSAAIAALPGLVAARPGYDADDAPALILGFRPPLPAEAAAQASALAAAAGVKVAAVEATPAEQIRYDVTRSALGTSEIERLLRAPDVPDFRPPTRGLYESPKGADAPHLDAVDASMRMTVCSSPDAGWAVLRAFLEAPLAERMTIGMYQFTAPHIYEALRRRMRDSADARLCLGLHPHPEDIPEGGTKSHDIRGDTIVKRFRRNLGDRFEYSWASVGSDGAFASAYHIKVAVADGKRMWLSSGNWQSSNQPPETERDGDTIPMAFANQYNREHHVVIEHAGLARTFEKFLDYDRDLSGAFPSAVPVEPPELVVPPDEVSFEPPTFFAPLVIDRKVRVQPILTPDNYAEHVTPLIAAATQSVYFQNQYITLNADGDFPEFRKLVRALLAKVEAGLDVRIICRDYMAPEKVDMLVALGFKRPGIRFMKGCHAKLIVVDGKRALVGSHNWSNEGAVSNRDASLLIDDDEVAGYLAKIFLDDWGKRAKPRAARRQPRVARDGETPFTGATRVAWAEIYDEPPAVPRPAERLVATTARPIVAAPATDDAGAIAFDVTVRAAAAGDDQLTFNGINGVTGEYLTAPVPWSEVKTLARRAFGIPDRAEQGLADRSAGEHFAPQYNSERDDLRQVGWGIVFAAGTSDAVREALGPLRDHRRAGTIERFYRETEYPPGESFYNFLKRHNVTPGSLYPHRLPYHLLLVGSPEEIPFELQYLLDLEYSVGRIHFDTAEEYAQYAKGVVAAETGGGSRPAKQAVFFGTRHEGDMATQMSAKYLVAPLTSESELGPAVAGEHGFEQHVFAAQKATRAQLIDVLRGDGLRPGLLFSASHGMGFPIGADQTKLQGALLMQDFGGFGQLKREHYLAAEDVPAGAKVQGMIAMIFACYGAGTPLTDSFPRAPGPPAVIAERPFVAALPRRLLAGGALAVIGHVERAWGYSIKPFGASEQIGPFRNCLGQILRGDRVGIATEAFHERAAILSMMLANLFQPGAPPVDEMALVNAWIERNDAKAYILLGDPAVRLQTA